MPYLPQTTRVFVAPENYLERIGNLVDDGSYYRVFFESGYYEEDVSLVLTTGGLALESYPGHLAIFRGELKQNAHAFDTLFAFTAPDLRIHGMGLHGTLYADGTKPAGAVIESGAPDRIFRVATLRLGAAEWLGVKPAYLELTELQQLGYTFTSIYPSRDPTAPSEVLIQDCDVRETGSNSSFTVSVNWPVGQAFGNPGEGVQANIRILGHRGYGINGPDGSAFGNLDYHLHKQGCATLQASRLGSETQVYAEDLRLEAHIYGSDNHDLHCFRLHFLSDPAIQITFKDCSFFGHWHEGSMTGNGGGAPYLGYYHGTSGVAAYEHFYPDLPTISFNNCTWEATLPVVRDQDPNFILFSAGSPSDYHFYDNSFKFNDPTGTYVHNLARDVDTDEASHGNVVTHYHNCTRSGWGGDPLGIQPNGVPTAAGHIHFDDSDTLQFGPEDWHRIEVPETLALPDASAVLLNGTFTGATSWTLGGSASVASNRLSLLAAHGSFFDVASSATQVVTVAASQSKRAFALVGSLHVAREDAPALGLTLNGNLVPHLSVGVARSRKVFGVIPVPIGATSLTVTLDVPLQALGDTNLYYIDNLALVQV